MKYNLTELQRYDTATLQDELNIAGVISAVNGNGPKAFRVITGDEAGADIVVQAHITKSDVQHDSDIDTMNKAIHLESGLANGRSITKAIAFTILSEINILRAQHSLPARTPAQFKTAVKSKL